MNLLHITPYYAPAWSYGGVVRAVTDLTQAQARVGHKVSVLTTDTLSSSRRASGTQETRDGVSVTRVRNVNNTIRWALNLSTPRRFRSVARRLIAENHIDLIHCHELRTVENLLVMSLARRLNRPIVVSPHGTLPSHIGRSRTKHLWDRVFGTYLLSNFDRIIALTDIEAKEVHDLWTKYGISLGPDQVSVVPNGVFPDDFTDLPSGDVFRGKYGLRNGPIVLFLGRLADRKGLDLLIPAFEQASREVPDARLLIVGPDHNMRSKLVAQVSAHHLASKVYFTGMLQGDEKLAALAAADIFVLPAVGEGLSVAVLEAMACGLPVVLTKGCNFPEVEQAGAGLIVEREIIALSEALGSLLFDRERRTRMGTQAYELVHARYLWPQIVAQMDRVYEDALRRRAAGVQE